MKRRRHFDYEERLSREAQEYGKALFDRGRGWQEIADGIKQRYSQKIGKSSIARYFTTVVIPARRAFEKVEQGYRGLLNALRDHPDSDDARVARALLFQALLENEGPLAGTEGEKLIAELRRLAGQNIERDKVDALENKGKKLADEVKKGKHKDPKELGRKLDELFGRQ
jgi:hypothetical protein